MNTKLSTLGGVGLGAAMMYVLDPRHGRRRRALLRDKLVTISCTARDAAGKVSRDLRNRAVGAVAEVRSRLRREAVSDEVVEERVRASIGPILRHSRSVAVAARDGRVTLSGSVLADEVDRLLARVASVRGVTSVEDHLEIHQQPDSVPGLQGDPGPRTGERFELMQQYWSPAARLTAGLAGGALAVGGVVTRGVLGAALGLAGVALSARALTNLELKRLVGIGAGRRAVTLQKTISVGAPVSEIFDVWTAYEDFPRFMAHVREVRRTATGQYHWVIAGPAGLSVEWDTVVTVFDRDRELAWKTLPGSLVAHAGVVRFDPNPDGTTRIDVKMSYNPPAGAFGHVLASLLGSDPKRAMDEDLARFKSLLEYGKTTTDGEVVTRDDLARDQRYRPGAERRAS
jgi:uncharacterized membrane protein